MMPMLAVVKDKPIEKHLVVEKMASPRPPAGWVLVKVELTGICGSDLHTYHWTPDYQIRFKNKLPRVIGHEFTGTIRELGEAVTGWEVGDRVVARTPISCGECTPCLSGRESICNSRLLQGVDYDGTMAEEAILPASNCFRLPPGYPPLLAALSEPISIAYNAVLKAGALIGRTVAIIGPGPLGYLIALLAKLSGVSRILILGLPKDHERIDLFRENIEGVETFDDLAALKTALAQNNMGPGADVVFEASGAPKGAQIGLEIAGKMGQVILVGIVTDVVSVNTNLAVRSEILLAGSAAAPKRVWMRMLNHLAQLSEMEKARFERVVTHRFPLEKALDAFQTMEAGAGLKMMLWPEGG